MSIPDRTAEPAPEPRDSKPDERADVVARLFREHNDMLVQFLTNRLRSRQDAREVAQEAYVRLLSLDKPDSVGFLRAFLFKIAANLAVDRIRHRQRSPVGSAISLFDEPRELRTPEDAAASAQELELLAQLVAQLPPKCRHAFLLKKVHGLEVSEVAAHMNLSERMARDYILRGLLYCRAGLAHARGVK